MAQRNNRVAVIMSSYNGGPYIEEQIDSVLGQTGMEVDLYVRDDGSTDNTAQILERYASDARVNVTYGENVGIGKSFMSLLQAIPDSYDYYAFSDQDDIWDEDKLAVAVNMLSTESGCALYASNLQLVDENNHAMGLRFEAGTTVDCSLLSAINHNVFHGCTQVFNKELFLLLRHKTPTEQLLRLRLHDTWVAASAAAAGKIVFDNEPHIRYRRHGNNFSRFDSGKVEVWRRKFSRLFHPDHRNPRSKTAQEVIEQYPDYVEKNADRDLIYNLAKPTTMANKVSLIRHRKRFTAFTDESDTEFIVKVIAGVI